MEVRRRGEEGQGLVEYGLLLGLVFLVVAIGGGLGEIGTGLMARFGAVPGLFNT